jgi:hypothetical protein
MKLVHENGQYEKGKIINSPTGLGAVMLFDRVLPVKL